MTYGRGCKRSKTNATRRATPDGERIALTLKRDAADALPLDTPLFTVPDGLVRILDRDLIAAGIPKSDERGCTIDVHALRYSFGTLLSKGGVAPRTAQAAMRHSDIALTMMTYTDPKLLDVQGALDALPSLPLTDSPIPKRESARATGTDHARSSLGQTLGKIGTSEGISSHSLTHSPALATAGGSKCRDAENLTKPSEKALFAGFANKASQVGATGRRLNFFWDRFGHGNRPIGNLQRSAICDGRITCDVHLLPKWCVILLWLVGLRVSMVASPSSYDGELVCLSCSLKVAEPFLDQPTHHFFRVLPKHPGDT